jgi:hypothetical protein
VTARIREVDPNHLILGDRYNGNKGLPEPVLAAMTPYVDVLSIQYFCGPGENDRAEMLETFLSGQRITGKPVINADIGNWTATELNPKRATGLRTQAARAGNYIESISTLLHQPWFIGWHWCAYVENTARGWGMKDPWDEPYADFVDPVQRFNRAAVEQWTADFTRVLAQACDWNTGC